MKYPTKRLIIWRSLVQAQAGPQKKVVTQVVTTFFYIRYRNRIYCFL